MKHSEALKAAKEIISLPENWMQKWYAKCQALQGQYKDAYYHSTAEQAVKAFADENGIV